MQSKIDMPFILVTSIAYYRWITHIGMHFPSIVGDYLVRMH